MLGISWFFLTRHKNSLMSFDTGIFFSAVVLLSVSGSSPITGASSGLNSVQQPLRLCYPSGGLIFKSLWKRKSALITRPVYPPVSPGQGHFDQLQINWPVREIFNFCDLSWRLSLLQDLFFSCAFSSRVNVAVMRSLVELQLVVKSVQRSR